MLTFTSSTKQAAVKVISSLHLAKAFRSYPKWKRARDAASWVRGEVTVTPTVKLAASVFGVSSPLVKAQLERRELGKHHAVNGKGTTALSDDALDRIVSAIGADRVLAAVDRATQPQLPLAAAEGDQGAARTGRRLSSKGRHIMQTNCAGQNIASDEKWVFEVRGGVHLIFGERTRLADGWWFSTNSDPFGPFETDQAAAKAAADASDETAQLNIVWSPVPPLPVTDPGEVYPLARQDEDESR
jgi:hypothetical protein